jgi:hypothetical protein
MKMRRHASRVLLGIVFIVSWFYVFGPAALPLVPSSVQVIAPQDIVSNGDNSYYAAFTEKSVWPALEIGVDSPVQPRGSNLSVFEDGRKLGPAHAMHADIAKIGGGRYSHWNAPDGSIVLFSASDNSDPRANGRRYTVVAPPQFSSLLFVVVVLPISMLVLQWLLSPWLVGGTLALAASAFVAWIWFFFGHLTLGPDSTTYTEWLPLVPLGYPLFLSGIKFLFGSLAAASAVQVTLTGAASLFVAFSIAKFSGRQAAGFAALLMLLCCLPMFSAAGLLLSEALFVPLLLLNIGAAIYLIAEPRPLYAILLALTASLIMFVRPAGYFAPLGVAFLTIACASSFRWLAKWAITPMVAFIVATLLINLAVRGSASPSQVGRILFPHVAFLFDPGSVTGLDREFALVVDEALKPHRAGYRKAIRLADRFIYSMNDYNPRLLATDKAIYATLEAGNKSGSSDALANFRRLDSIYVRLFVSTIYNRPIDYLWLVRDQILGAWQLSILLDPGPFAQTYTAVATDNYQEGAQLIKAWKLPLSEQALLPNSAAFDKFPGHFIDFFETLYKRIRSQRWLFYTIGVVTLLAMPIAACFRRRSKHWMALGYCGVIIHGSMLLTAAVTVFIPRYAWPVDPVILVAGVIIVDGLLSWGWAAMRQLEARTTLADFLKTISFRNPRAVSD